MSKTIPIVDTKDLINLNKRLPDPVVPAVTEPTREMAMIRSMMDYARPRPQANLEPIVIPQATRKTKLCLAIMPKWAIYFAPYGIARITSVARAAGFDTKTFDFNVETYHRLKTLMPAHDNPYNGAGATDFLWLDDQWHRLKPFVEPLLHEYVDRILAHKPDVIGLSLYYTNVIATRWAVAEIKRRAPHVIVIGGGAQMQWVKAMGEDPYPEFDYKIQGEAEQLFLDLLLAIEHGNPPTVTRMVADQTKRLDLDQLPFPDYSDMNLDLYTIPNAISSELSRGCVAKCAFCPETLFWKYRSRQSMRILEEVESQHRKYGTEVFWFLDSLVNGNINELRAFVLGVREKGLSIKWQGYARCDERMDLEYFQDLAAGGCMRLDYGIESGSQRVLDAMRKNVKVHEIEQNLVDGAKVGIRAYTNWMTCFANEGPSDIARTMTLAWRMQGYIDNMARGTMGIGLNYIEENRDEFNVDARDLWGQWTTKDFTLTKIHRLIRYKTFNMFIEQMPLFAPKDWSKIHGLDQTYSYSSDCVITPANCEQYLDIDYEDFDYEIIQAPELNWKFSQTLVNEVWPFVRTLWRSRHRAAMTVTVTFDPKWDMDHFGDRLAGNLEAVYNFSIDAGGHWQADCRFKFQPPGNNPFAPHWRAQESEQHLDFAIDLTWQGQGHW